MKKGNYYNDSDTKVCGWARELIKQKAVPHGEVDSRSILEVTPSDLDGFTQCHFFSGLLGWSLALRLAGWPEDQPVWSASLPCQPFSSAGKQKGSDDERHLWPVFKELVAARLPAVIFGEQVSSKLARDDWFTGVCVDLEGLGYTVEAVDICAPLAGEVGEGRIVRGGTETWEPVMLGAPHIRQRLYWVAYRGVADALRGGREVEILPETHGGEEVGVGEADDAGGAGTPRSMADAGSPHELRDGGSGTEGTGERSELSERRMQQARCDGPYSNFRTLPCRDGKARRVEPSIQCLVAGLPRGVVPSGDPSSPEYANATSEARAMRLKGYGNAIVPPLAALFIRSFMEVTHQ